MDNLKSIRNSFLLLTFLALVPLGASPSRQGPAFQEMRITLEDLSYDVSSQRVDIDILDERLFKLEKSLSAFRSDLKPPPSDNRLSALEKRQEALLSDLKSLQKELSTLGSQLTSVKTSLHSMLALLGTSNASTYTVKEGDSLGQIALIHKTTTKALKEHNQLASDRIYVGQKLNIP